MVSSTDQPTIETQAPTLPAPPAGTRGRNLRRRCGMATAGLVAALLPAGLPAHAGVLVTAAPSLGGTLDLTQFADFVHFVGTSPEGRAVLGANGLPAGAVLSGNAFRNFSNTYGNGAGEGEISREDNAAAVRLAYGTAPGAGAPASRAIWFGDYGARTGVGFDVALPSAAGVLSVFTGGFCGHGSTLSAGVRGSIATVGAASPTFCGHHAAEFTVAWNDETPGELLHVEVNNDPLTSGGTTFGNTGVIGAFVQSFAPAADVAEQLLQFTREGADHSVLARIRTPMTNLTQIVFDDSFERDGRVVLSALQSIDYSIPDQIFLGKSGVAATTLAEVVDTVGVQRAAVRATSNDPRYDAEVSTETHRWDYMVVDGGEGRGQARLTLDVHGVLGGGDEYMNMTFSKQDAGLGGRASTVRESLGQFYADAFTHGAGEFRDEFTVDVGFEYGVPFRIDSLMELYAHNGGSADFANTVDIARFVLPAGASLRSSGLLHGTVDEATYAVRNVPVPAPIGVAGVGAFAALLLARTQRRHVSPPA